MRHPHAYALWLWRTLPWFVIVACMLLPMLSWRAAWVSIAPPLALMAFYHWSLAQHTRFGYEHAFALGLLQDIISGAPLGLFAAAWVLMRALLVAGRREVHGHGFMAAWMFLAVLLFITLSAVWIARCVLEWHFYWPLKPLLQWMTGVLLYPLLHEVLYGVERFFFRRYWHVLKHQVAIR